MHIQDNTSKVTNERSYKMSPSIGPRAWEVPIWTNIPERECGCVGAAIKWEWA